MGNMKNVTTSNAGRDTSTFEQPVFFSFCLILVMKILMLSDKLIVMLQWVPRVAEVRGHYWIVKHTASMAM